MGAELRKLRERAGIAAGEAARAVGMKQSDLSHLEAGRQAVSGERVRALAAHYGVMDTALVDALAAMTGRQKRGWWESCRGVLVPALLDGAELEHHAHSLREFQVVHIPGLLQTEAYMRALFTYAGAKPDHLDSLVDFRMRRRDVLGKPSGPEYTAVIHEAALRMIVGDRRIARDQLTYILERAEEPGITVRVVPFAVEGFAGMGDSMLYAEGPVPQLDTAHIDQVHGSVFLDSEADLARYRVRWALVERLALSIEQSRDAIQRMGREL
ncbi:helix-turn-helix transcriptional regulator [Streptomyces palmae]|uniref:helix-turn-helix domain-containing protein n=1 Tax=Streptomyces palmae TaxID=1701085 RepID=UPI0031590B37